MFIDFHAHAYRKPVPWPVRFPTAEEVIARYDEAGIEQGCLLPVVNPEIYLPQANEDILEMCEQYPDRLIPWCNIDPRALTNSVDAPLEILLQHYKDLGCKGVGEIMLNVPTRDPFVQNLFKCAAKVGLPVTWDGSDQVGGDFGLYDDPGLPQMEHTLLRFPNLTVVAHGPVFWAELTRLETPAERKPAFRPSGGQTSWPRPTSPITEEGAVQVLLRRHPNLFAELSDAYYSLNRDHEYGPKFLTEFQDRLVFGTDLCSPTMPIKTYELLVDWHEQCKLSDEVFGKLMRGNAEKLLGLV